jgi:hypothetical protein
MKDGKVMTDFSSPYIGSAIMTAFEWIASLPLGTMSSLTVNFDDYDDDAATIVATCAPVNAGQWVKA